MREILDVILEEKFDPDRRKLLFLQNGELIDKIDFVLAAGQKYEGSFTIQAPEDKYTYGYISAGDSRMECITNNFSGTEEVHFCYYGEYLEEDEVCRGHFLIRSNQGEYVLPYEVRARRQEIHSSAGPICNLIQFGNLAKTNWQEALNIFYSPLFEMLIREKEPQLYLCYQGLSAIKRNEHNLDQFLISAGKKQRMSYFVEDNLLTLDNPVEVAEISLGIVRNGWGYTHLDVETDGDFVFVEKETITDDDFLGNRYKLSIYIDSEKLHAGRNFGKVILWDNDESVEVPVEVYCCGSVIPGREIRREKRKNSLKLTEIYQAFRLKEMNTAGWLKETDRLVQRMMSLDERDGAAKLFFAQILITAERYNEAGWILEHFGENVDRMDPDLEAYYLYLSSLLRRDDAYTKQVAGQIAKIYKEQGESWRAAWLLLYVSKEYERSITGKWLFLEEQFEYGCRSPIIYFEAVQLLNRNPALLRKIERFELQVLYYGNKKGILSPELLEQVYYLAGKVRDFSLLLYLILEKCYEKTKDERIVKEICTLLIKGNRVEKKYYQWFKLGIEAGVRITNLYEYYMMSLDLEKEQEIPKIVLMYFIYQSNLDYAHAAYLYSYVAEHREEYPDIYESYVHRIEGFVKIQIQKNRMNESLNKLYHHFLTEEMIQKQNAAAMINVLFACNLQTPNSLIKNVYVYQEGSRVPTMYAVAEKNVWIPVFSGQSCVVWEDSQGNRFPAGTLLGMNRNLADHPLVNGAAVYIEDNTSLDLYLYDAKEMTSEADTQMLYRLFRLWENEKVLPRIRREAAVKIMKYYYQTQDKSNLAAYLESLSARRLTRREASEAIKYMVYCRMDELAYQWMDCFSPVLVDSKIAASLVAAIIKKRDYQADEHLLALAFDTFEKGKYNNEILRYLAMHYEGTAYEQYQVWKAALACGIEIKDLSERLLLQMLFTGDYVEEHCEVLKKYLKDEPELKLVWAYMIRRSYAYYLDGFSLDNSIAEFILRAFKEQEQLPVICELACLKYYAGAEMLPDAEREALLTALLKKQMFRGIHLPWFAGYRNLDVDFSSMADKTILEYHAKNEGTVKFRFLPVRDDFSQVNWKIVNMYPVCRRVFFTEQVLFFGESIQYEILEEVDGDDVVVKSGVLKKSDSYGAQDSRFQSINAILEAAALEDHRQFEILLEDYLKKDFINSYLFKLM